MPLIKLNNRSIKDVTSLPFGVGNLIHISSQTANDSASISFTTGIDSTYKEYQFYFINIRPATDGANFQFNLSTDSGSNYNVTKTTTFFRAYHLEDDSTTGLNYSTDDDLAQSTGYQNIRPDADNDADSNSAGTLQLFNPSSTTYVKHFIADMQGVANNGNSSRVFIGGYGNTTSAINAIKFQFSSGNIADGTIAMFGVL
jgi:hypothetical protein